MKDELLCCFYYFYWRHLSEINRWRVFLLVVIIYCHLTATDRKKKTQMSDALIPPLLFIHFLLVVVLGIFSVHCCAAS